MNKRKPFMLLFLVAGVSALLGSCADGAGTRLVPPDERGPFLAALRVDALPGEDGLDLPVLIWAPAAGGEEAGYNYDGIGLTEGQVVADGAFDCPTPRPVVVFSHGHGGVNFQSFTLTEHLARHGFVVAAPAHVYNTFLDMDEALHPYLFVRRPLDVAATFDWLVDEAARPESVLAGCVDAQAGYAVVGHSFGGFTALATAGASLDMAALAADCEGDTGSGCDRIRAWRQANPGADSLDASDDRVWAAVPLAPAWHGYLGAGLARIAVPTAVVGGELDETTTWADEVRPSYDGLTTTPRLLAGLTGAGHYSFTDFCLVVGAAADGCGEGFRPVAEVLATVDALVLAFLQRCRGFAQAQRWLPPSAGVFHFEEVRR